jgi:alpha-tubulin suppressor-like RCC1 family protein
MNDSPNPAPVPGLDGVMVVAAGSGHTVALKSDGTVWTWGSSNLGKLGNATTKNMSYPVAVLGLSDVTAIAAGESDP